MKNFSMVSSRKGLALLEIILALCLSSLILLTTGQALNLVLTNWEDLAHSAALMQQTRMAVYRISLELRHAHTLIDHRADGNKILTFESFQRGLRGMQKMEYFADGSLKRRFWDYSLRNEIWEEYWEINVLIGPGGLLDEPITVADGDFLAVPLKIDEDGKVVELVSGDIGEAVALKLMLTVRPANAYPVTVHTIVYKRNTKTW